MNTHSKKALTDFLNGIPTTKRRLNPDINHPMDYKRLVKVAKSLLEENEVLTVENIKSVCEEIGGTEYTQLIKTTTFSDKFSSIILSEINKAKHIITIYKEL